jgi:hypothetical protein
VHKEWFQNPERQLDPKSLFCCGAADVVKTKFMVEQGGDKYPEDVWYAWLNDTWTKIPTEKIVKDYAPDDQAHLFMLGGHNPVLCTAQGRPLIIGRRSEKQSPALRVRGSADSTVMHRIPWGGYAPSTR